LKPLSWGSTNLSNQAGLGAFGAKVAALGSSVWLSEATSKGAPELAVSTDGGGRFTLHPAPKLAAVTPCDLWAITAVTLWARCVTGTLVGFAHSGDGGARWTFAKVGPLGYPAGGAFAPVTPSVAFLAAGMPSDELYRITGSTGAASKRGKVPYGDVLSLVFTSTTDGMAVGLASPNSSPQLASTANGGKAWTPRPLPR